MEEMIKIISQLHPIAQVFCVIGFFAVWGLGIWGFFKWLRGV